MTVVEWAEANWIVPETKQPIVLRPWQLAVLLAIFPDASPSPWETFLISTVKKAGKTELDAIAVLYAVLTFPAPETAFVVANDEAQAQDRVFERIAGAVRAMGLVKRGAAVVSKSEIVFPETGSRVVAIPADFAGAAGAVFGISSWTETWAFRHEGHVRLWEELTPIPNRRSLRIVDSYAGFSGDSPILEPMWTRALAGERLDGDLPVFAAGKLWAFIDTGEEAQQRAWLGDPGKMKNYYAEQAASLRPGTFARLHLNAWQSGEEAFVTAADWDGCVDRSLGPLLPEQARHLRLSVGVDAATKGDCAAVVAVARERDGRLRLVSHRIWTPRKGEPLDLEETIEQYLLQLKRQYRIARVLFDPFQMARSAATLKRTGLPLEEMPQTSGNLTAAGQNLYEFVRSRNLVLYPDRELRTHALNAVAVETGRGWRLAKEKASRKIDGVVALSFAALDAVEHSSGPLRTSSPARITNWLGQRPGWARNSKKSEPIVPPGRGKPAASMYWNGPVKTEQPEPAKPKRGLRVIDPLKTKRKKKAEEPKTPAAPTARAGSTLSRIRDPGARAAMEEQARLDAEIVARLNVNRNGT